MMTIVKIIPITLLLLIIPLFLIITPGLAQEPPPGPPEAPAIPPAHIPGEILVKFRPLTERPAQLQLKQQSLLNAMGATPLDVSAYSGVMRLKVPPGREAEIIATLQARGDVEFAELNQIVTGFGPPNDPSFSLQWGLNNTGQTGGTADADIDAPEAWDIETGNGSVIIAIIDSGVDLDHPDLQANIITGYDFVNDDNDPDDDNGHGTHVAGIAAAVGNNGTGIAGTSWNTKIMPVKVLAANNSGTIFNVVQGIDYAVANGTKIINMSLGVPYSGDPCFGQDAILTALQNAVANDVLVVAAAGNQNYFRVSCPAAFDEAFAVGATNHNDNRWIWGVTAGSNYENRLDISAPGEDIYSTIPSGQYGYKTGTSMATPYVAGLAALLWSYAPSLQATNVRTIIESSADDLGTAGFDPYFGHGRINARRALSLVSLKTQAAQTEFLLDDSQVSTTGPLQLLSADTNPITWTATLSPTVSWLGLSATSGTISAATSPTSLTMTLTHPAGYGVYSTTVSIIDTNNPALSLDSRSTGVQLTYSPVQLRVSPAPVTLAIDDDIAEPLSQSLQLTSTAQAPVTWTATISPTVAWLAVSPPAGLTSAAAGPSTIDLSATRPATYGLHTAELLITGLNSAGQVVDTQTVSVTINYSAPSTWYQYLPFILKNDLQNNGDGSNTLN